MFDRVSGLRSKNRSRNWQATTVRWTSLPWRLFAHFNGICGTLSMFGAVFLTLYSLWLYLTRYGGIFTNKVRA